MIKFSSVTKRYGDGTLALHEVDLEIEESEFVFVVGPSGAGKTTLVKLLIKEEVPTSGSVFFGKKEVNLLSSHELPSVRRQIGVVFQDFRLLPNRTVYENVALALEVAGKSANAGNRAVEDILELVNLRHKSRSFPNQLSGGERQRTAIARALVHNPKVLMADEPTAEIDPSLTWSVMEMFNRVNQAGTTVVVATHDPDIVNSLKKRVVALDAGRVVRDEKGGFYES